MHATDSAASPPSDGQQPTQQEIDHLVVLHESGEHVQMEQATRALIERSPASALVWNVLAMALQLQGKDALHALQKTVELAPGDAEALLLEPHNIDALNNLGMALQADGQLEAALASFRQVAPLAPNNPVTHSNIAAMLNDMGQREAALESCRLAVKLCPKSAAAHINLGTCLMEMGRLSDAIKSFETVVKLDPHHRRAHINISAALTRQGHIDQAIVHARQALKINPDWDELHSNLLFYLTHSQNIDATALFVEHLRYAEHFEAPLRASWPEHGNVRDPERRLRIGFVSADLYNHSIASFITPILEHLVHSSRLDSIRSETRAHE